MSQRRLPAEIYWRRRLLLLAAVIALVWVVLQVTGGDDEPDAKPAATPSSGTPTVRPTPSVKVNGIVDVGLTTSTKACDPQQIRITPTVRSGQPTKAAVAIGLVVSSTSSSACTLRPKDADVVAVISANGTPIWDSTVCKVSLLDDPVAVTPQWASLVRVQWTGRGSGSGCSPKEGYASPGTYTVQIGTLGGEPGKTSFTLKIAPRPAATSPTPTRPTPSTATTTPAPPKGTTKPADD